MGFINSIKARLRGYKPVGSSLPNPRLVLPKAKVKKSKKTPPMKPTSKKPKDRFADNVPLLRQKSSSGVTPSKPKMFVQAGRKKGGIIPTASKPRRDVL